MNTLERAHGMLDTLNEKQLNEVIIFIESFEHETKQSKNSIVSLRGIFHDVADKADQEMEKKAWEQAAIEKHLRIMRDTDEVTDINKITTHRPCQEVLI